MASATDTIKRNELEKAIALLKIQLQAKERELIELERKLNLK